MNDSQNQFEFAENMKNGKCPPTVGFRMEETDGAALATRAKSLGVSVHELARHYVVLAVNERDKRTELHDVLLAVRAEILDLKRNVVLSTQALLTSAGKVPAETALDWVKKNLSDEFSEQ